MAEIQKYLLGNLFVSKELKKQIFINWHKLPKEKQKSLLSLLQKLDLFQKELITKAVQKNSDFPNQMKTFLQQKKVKSVQRTKDDELQNADLLLEELRDES